MRSCPLDKPESPACGAVGWCELLLYEGIKIEKKRVIEKFGACIFGRVWLEVPNYKIIMPTILHLSMKISLVLLEEKSEPIAL